jgi:hypothetical protein
MGRIDSQGKAEPSDRNFHTTDTMR